MLHSNIIFSVLHAMMGIANDGVDHVMDCIKLYIEEIPQEEVGLMNSILILMQSLAKACHARDEWGKSVDGKQWKSILNKIKTRKKNLESGNGDFAKYSSEIIDLENELNELNGRRSPFVNSHPAKAPYMAQLVMHYELSSTSHWGWPSGIVCVLTLARRGFETGCNNFFIFALASIAEITM